MLKYLVLIIFTQFVALSADCSTRASLHQQKSNIQQQLKTATGTVRVELLLKLSSFYSDSVNTAIIFTRIAIAEAAKIQDQFWMARAYTNLATLLLQSGSPNDSSAKYLDYSEKAFSKSGKKLFDPEFYYAQAKYHYALNQIDQAGTFCEMAIKTAQAEKNGIVLANTYVLLARIAKKKSDLKQFVEYLRLAEKEYLLCSDKESSGRLLISVGLLYTDAGMNDMSQKVLVEATKLCEKYSDSLYLGYLYCNISGIYGGSSNKEMSLQTLGKAVTIFTRLHNNKGLGYAQNMLGLYYVEQKKYKDALNWFAKTIHSDTLAAEWQGACFAACNMVDVYVTVKKYEPIAKSLVQAEKYMQRAGDPLSAIVFYNTKARFQVSDKNFTEAIANFNTSLRLAGETRNNIFYLDNLKSLADLYNLAGDESLSLQYFRRYVEAGDSVRSAQAEVKQQELLSQLNAGELIDMAVKEKEKSGAGYTHSITLAISIVGIMLMFALSVKAFGRNPKTMIPNSGENFTHNTDNNGVSTDKPAKIFVSQEMQQLIWERLQKKMKEEKVFLHPELSLHEMAELLETNTSYLSKVINERTGQNFNSFVNQYRIEEACLLLTNHKQQYLSIEGIALSVGFNSKSAFNGAFKKIKGFTPTEYIEQQKIVVG